MNTALTRRESLWADEPVMRDGVDGNPALGIAQRIINAADNFDTVLADIGGISLTQATEVRKLYIRERIAKLDPVMGRISVKHGAFLEKKTIRLAASQVKS